MKEFEVNRELYLYNIRKIDGYFYSIVKRFRKNLGLLSILLYPRTQNELDYAYHYLTYYHMEENINTLLEKEKLVVPVEENTAVKFIISLKDLYEDKKALKKKLNTFDEVVDPSEYAKIISDSYILKTYVADARKYIFDSTGINITNKTLNYINNTMYNMVLPPLDNIYITSKMKKVDGKIRTLYLHLLFTVDQVYNIMKEIFNECEKESNKKL